MPLIRILAAACVLALAAPAHAETSVSVMLHSIHYDRRWHHNEKNYGLGLEQTLVGPWSVAVGAYRNSFYRRSKYVMLVARPYRLSAHWRFGGAAGLVTGYQPGRTPVPMMAAIFTWTPLARVSADIIVTPVVTGMQLRFKLFH